jgi:hypothetical protein
MKHSYSIMMALAAAAGFAFSSSAAVLVNDTWADGDRTSSSPGGDSAWFFGGMGSLTVVGPGGPMRGDLTAGGTSSGSWTTYFAAAGNPVNLVTAGDMLRVTWQFSVSGLAAANTSQNFRLAVVNTPTTRLLADAAPPSDTYAGYGMFMNMGGATLGNANPFRLMERAAPATASAMLSASGSWAPLANGATTGNGGYEAGVLYTYMMQLQLNGTGGLDVVSSMTGGTLLNNTGSAVVNYTDATPNSLSFDTFSIRPSSASGTAQIFDTSRLLVEAFIVPEPSVFALLGTGLLGLILAHRRARR